MRNPLALRYQQAREAGRNTLSDAETKALYALLRDDSSPKAALVELYLSTGCRNSEGRAICRANLDTEFGTVTFDTLKRKPDDGAITTREVPIPQRLVRKLYHLYPDSSHYDECRLFNIERQTAWRWTKELMIKAGISATLAFPHTLRHSYIHRGIIGHVTHHGERKSVEKRLREYLVGHRPSARELTVHDLYAVIRGHEHRLEAQIMGCWAD